MLTRTPLYLIYCFHLFVIIKDVNIDLDLDGYLDTLILQIYHKYIYEYLYINIDN